MKKPINGDVDGVSETYFGDQAKSGLDSNIPFPPGFTLDNKDAQEAQGMNNSMSQYRSEGLSSRVLEDAQPINDHVSPVVDRKYKKGGSILEVLDNMIKAKKDWIKELNNKRKVNFLSIQETKLDHISDIDVKVLWGNYKFEHIISEAVGNSGGILCAWDPCVFRKEQHVILDNFVALYGSWVFNQAKLLMISIYAPQSITSKRTLWSYISSLISRWDGHCMVMGDFNEVRCMEDRLGLVFNMQGANEFNSFISNLGLVEIQLEGYLFTWSHQSAKKMSKLDRFFVTDGLLSLFPHLSGICLDRHLSDHRPILLREVVTDYGPSPFWVYHTWFSLQGFDQMVSEIWNNIALDDSNKMVRFKKKLQILKKEIRAWVNDYKKKQSGRLMDLRSKMCDIDKVLDQGGVNDDILLSRLDVLKNLHDIKSSDARVMIDGEWVDDPCCVKEEFRLHFANRFRPPADNRFKLNYTFPNRLNSDQVDMLVSLITRDEVRTAVWGCGENKSHGPDGYTFEFIRKYWDILGSDFCAAVEWFFDHSAFSKGCNSSFIALIPKDHDPKFVNDYRPISLIESLYKVVTKILPSRLSPVIFDLISDVQTAFLPYRQILNGPFIINELLSWCKHKKQHAIVFKVGFAKAYDSIRAIEAGIFKGIKIGSALNISHLFYADDAVFIGEWSIANLSGVMVGDNSLTSQAWDDTIGKCKAHLSNWKLKTLSIRGRLTLLKSVLGSTPIYNMSIYKVPKSVLHTLESIRRIFFNGVQGDERKITWIKWTKVLASKKYGGLDRGVDLISHSHIRVGNGLCTQFWNEVWIGDTPIRVLFPRVYALEINKVCTVADKLQYSVTSSLRRTVRGGVEVFN
nr:RNA-directed DNA polymerase, eukaryota [Tanacetum cinerariifolium]